ncbi:MAG: hypothetical protein SHS37scaffold296_35 [Burkholderiales phage 68_11]|jgi:transcriptional regulator with XRE-family HTH domain|nr:MAG: hypothetical protein SHS37scaffold296_35 [Burkholderiales phage 68_11]
MTMTFDIQKPSRLAWAAQHLNRVSGHLAGGEKPLLRDVGCAHVGHYTKEFPSLKEIPCLPRARPQDKLADETPNMTVHSKIKELRLARGLSRREFADAIQRVERSKSPITPQTIGGWEDGRYAPKRTRLPVVAQALGTTVEELLSESAGTPVTVAAQEGRADYVVADNRWPFRQVAFVEIKNLPPESLAQLERVIGAYLGIDLPTVLWRPTALRLAAELDQARGNDEFTTFVRALDLELERERAKLTPTRRPTAKAAS